jgi:hypothetical protein
MLRERIGFVAACNFGWLFWNALWVRSQVGSGSPLHASVGFAKIDPCLYGCKK